jgi:putative heme-binding domain-containing protein
VSDEWLPGGRSAGPAPGFNGPRTLARSPAGGVCSRLMMMKRFLLLAACVVAFAPTTLLAQPYAPADIQFGAKIFGEQCTVCHGGTGDGVAGVDLRANRFKRSTTDADLRRVISEGVQGTSMPPFKFDGPELTAVIAYLRNMRTFDAKSSLIGDEAKGKAVFEGKGQCGTCHRVNGKGPRVAPDLSDIGALRTPDALMKAVLDPESEIRHSNRYIRAVTRDGKVINGRRLNEDTYTVQVIDENEKLVSLIKANLREYGLVRRTPMPAYRDKLTSEEMADLLAYLLSLKGM